jgi:ABC-type Fe3+ transport system permease subunit
MNIQQPDSKEKKLLVVLVLVIGAFGAAFVIWLYRWGGQIRNLLLSQQYEEARRQSSQIKLLISGALIFCLFALAVLAIDIGYRAFKEKRFPPSQSRVLVPTRIHEGEAAIQRAKICYLIGASFLLATLVCTFWAISQ